MSTTTGTEQGKSIPVVQEDNSSDLPKHEKIHRSHSLSGIDTLRKSFSKISIEESDVELEGQLQTDNNNNNHISTDLDAEILRRELMVLLEKKENILESLSLSSQGYNDVGISIEGLQASLVAVSQEIDVIDEKLRTLSDRGQHLYESSIHVRTLDSPRSLRTSYSFSEPSSPGSARFHTLSSKTRKFTLQLKKELLPLDPRTSLFTKATDDVRGTSKKQAERWTYNESNKEAEKEKWEVFSRTIAFLQSRGVVEIEFSDLQLKLDSDNDNNGSLIGEGSTCKVYAAKWNNYDVAVKVFKNKKVNIKSFLRECLNLYRSQHPGICILYGICAKPPAIVMELLKGETLYQILHKKKVKLDMSLLVKIAKEIAVAMYHLHYSVEIIHRDLNPYNIYVDHDSNNLNYTIKISGLKFSRDDSDAGENGMPGGSKSSFGMYNTKTLRWRAPEITKGQANYSGKVDVYSYGVILWEMLSGKVPYKDYDSVTAAAKAAYEIVRPEIPSSCPPILKKLISRCWDSDPDSRPGFREIIKFFDHIEGKLFFSRRGGFWTLDKEQEIERERRRQEKYHQVVGFLKSSSFLIDYEEITIGDKIGAGSFAKVWEGNWHGYRVAVKKLRNPSITEKFFVREVFNLQKAHHPNVVLFMGCCVSPPCIITEFMPGGTLFDCLHVHNIKFSLRMILKTAFDIAQGMDFLHTLNLVHRDLTSKNLLLDELHNVKISDFGLSREFDPEMSLAGICNPRWRPPEITKGEKYTQRVDVYCFGIVLNEMVSNEVPFYQYDGVTAAAKAAYENERPAIPGDCPPALRQLITTCWDTNPGKRPSFASVVQILHHIRVHLSSEADSADGFEPDVLEEIWEVVTDSARSEPDNHLHINELSLRNNNDTDTNGNTNHEVDSESDSSQSSDESSQHEGTDSETDSDAGTESHMEKFLLDHSADTDQCYSDTDNSLTST